MDGPLSGSADTTRYRYDSARRTTGVAGPDPDGAGSLIHQATRTTYTNGLPTKVETGTVNSQSDADWAAFTAAQRVEQDYDGNARPTVSRLMSGSTAHSLTQTSYDSLGRVQCLAQRMNPAEFATGSLPSDACTLDTPGSYGPDRITRTYYDAAGQVTQVRTGYAVSGQEANETTVTYTANGQVETVTDAEGNRTTYEYDGLDRLRNLRYPSPTTDGVSAPTSGTGNDYEQLTYLTATVSGSSRSTPLVASRRTRAGETIGYGYDNLGRLVLKDVPDATWQLGVTYAYDLLGRLTSASDAYGHVQGLSWDALGRLTGETDNWLGGTMASQYDAAGRRTRLTWPDTFYVTYDYDTAGNMTAIRENGASSGVGVLAGYAYDSLGRRTSLTRGNGAVTSYGYDGVSRLNQLVENPSGTTYDLTLGYSYNPAGQIVSTTRSNDLYAWGGHYAVNRSYSANGRNQYSAAGSITPSYDARGNLTSAGSTTYGYDVENRLGYTHGTPNDPMGRLWAEGGDGFRYDGQDLALEFDPINGPLRRRHVHGPGGEPLVSYDLANGAARSWLHEDERGSVIALSNGSGTVTGVNAYDEYGIPASTNTGRFQYTGQAWLASLGLQYSRARIYSPTLGRFMQTDPIGTAGGMNIYAYVGNDPVNFIDPMGLDYEDLCLIVRACQQREGGDQNQRVIVVGPRNPLRDAIRDNRLLETRNDILRASWRPERNTERGSGEASSSQQRSVQPQPRRPTARQQACASATAATVAGAAMTIVAGSAATAALVPEPATPALGAFAIISGAVAAILAGYGTIGQVAFCE